MLKQLDLHDPEGYQRALKAHWNSDAAIRQEFHTFEVFSAYCHAAAQGRAKIIGRPVTPAPAAQGRPITPAPAVQSRPVTPAPAAQGRPITPAPAAQGRPVTPAPASVPHHHQTPTTRIATAVGRREVYL